MKVTRRLLAFCSIAAAFCVVAVAQNQRTRLTTDQELKQRFTENREDFDKLSNFFSLSEAADARAVKEFKKPGSIDPDLLRIAKQLHIIELHPWADGELEIVVNKDGRARVGYLFAPGRKNYSDKAPYVVLESLGDDWYLFRRS